MNEKDPRCCVSLKECYELPNPKRMVTTAYKTGATYLPTIGTQLFNLSTPCKHKSNSHGHRGPPRAVQSCRGAGPGQCPAYGQLLSGKASVCNSSTQLRRKGRRARRPWCGSLSTWICSTDWGHRVTSRLPSPSGWLCILPSFVIHPWTG